MGGARLEREAGRFGDEAGQTQGRESRGGPGSQGTARRCTAADETWAGRAVMCECGVRPIEGLGGR
jgi:hypothetical protein